MLSFIRPLTFDHFTQAVMQAMGRAAIKAAQQANDVISPEQLFVSILDEGSGAGAMIRALFPSQVSVLLEEINHGNRFGPKKVADPDLLKPYRSKEIKLSSPTKLILQAAIKKAKSLRHTCVGTEHVLVALFDEPDSRLRSLFDKLHIDRQKFCEAIENSIT